MTTLILLIALSSAEDTHRGDRITVTQTWTHQNQTGPYRRQWDVLTLERIENGKPTIVAEHVSVRWRQVQHGKWIDIHVQDDLLPRPVVLRAKTVRTIVVRW